MSCALLIPPEHFGKLERVVEKKVRYGRFSHDLSGFEGIWYFDESDGGDEISLYADEIVPVASFEDMRTYARGRHHLPGHETIREIVTTPRWSHKKQYLIGVYNQPRTRSKSKFPSGKSILVMAKDYRSMRVSSMSSSFPAAWKVMNKDRLERYALDNDFYFERISPIGGNRSEATIRYCPGKARKTAEYLNRGDAADHQVKSEFFQKTCIRDFANDMACYNCTPFNFDPKTDLYAGGWDAFAKLVDFLFLLEKTGSAKDDPYWRRMTSFGRFITAMRPAIFWLREYRQTREMLKPGRTYNEGWRRQAQLLWFYRWLTREYLWWQEEQNKKEHKPCNCTGSDSSTLPSIETPESTLMGEDSLLCLAQTA